MRLFSWSGISALACAATGGFLAGEAVHRRDVAAIQLCEASGELCDAPPTRFNPPQPIEEIDLTCPPMMVEAFAPQSMEPPLADAPADAIRTVNFELPAGSPVDPAARWYMPYLTDDGAPAPLPPLGEVPLLNPPTPMLSPTPDPSDPIYQAVKRFFDNAAILPELPRNDVRRPEDTPNSGSRVNGVTDKVPIGKPPVSEHPSAVKPEKPAAGPSPKANTTDIQPGDLPLKPTGKVN
jgi:hypothetical protein